MNISIRTFDKDELHGFKTSGLVALYNSFCDEIDGLKVKKFSDRTSAIRRVSKIQETYLEEVSKLKQIAARTPNKKKVTTQMAPTPRRKRVGGAVAATVINKDCTKIHGLDQNSQWQIALGAKVRKNTILSVIAEGQKLGEKVSIKDLISYVVDNATKDPKRKPMTPSYAAEYIKWYINKGVIELFNPQTKDGE